MRSAPPLIVWMSFRLAIPWRVALPQSPPPLRQPVPIMRYSHLAGRAIFIERRTVSYLFVSAEGTSAAHLCRNDPKVTQLARYSARVDRRIRLSRLQRFVVAGQRLSVLTASEELISRVPVEFPGGGRKCFRGGRINGRTIGPSKSGQNKRCKKCRESLHILP
jgi:hypothetical protein